jgi:beta-lactam-binding protein with PASTA domain
LSGSHGSKGSVEVWFGSPLRSARSFSATLSPQAEADATLRNGGLVAGESESQTHPTAARGDVVWQDPPPGVAVPQGQSVQLWISSGPQRVPVADLAGYDSGLAERLLRAAGLSVGAIEATQAPLPKGVVVNTRPPAGTVLSPGGAVTLVVSVGAPTITVPDIMHQTPEEATNILEQAGLVLGAVILHTDPTSQAGQIIAQDPAGGTLAAPGTAVNVTVARGGAQ